MTSYSPQYSRLRVWVQRSINFGPHIFHILSTYCCRVMCIVEMLQCGYICVSELHAQLNLKRK